MTWKKTQDYAQAHRHTQTTDKKTQGVASCSWRRSGAKEEMKIGRKKSWFITI